MRETDTCICIGTHSEDNGRRDVIFRERHKGLIMTQRKNLIVIHVDRIRTFGNRYTLESDLMAPVLVLPSQVLANCTIYSLMFAKAEMSS